MPGPGQVEQSPNSETLTLAESHFGQTSSSELADRIGSSTSFGGSDIWIAPSESDIETTTPDTKIGTRSVEPEASQKRNLEPVSAFDNPVQKGNLKITLTDPKNSEKLRRIPDSVFKYDNKALLKCLTNLAPDSPDYIKISKLIGSLDCTITGLPGYIGDKIGQNGSSSNISSCQLPDDVKLRVANLLQDLQEIADKVKEGSSVESQFPLTTKDATKLINLLSEPKFGISCLEESVSGNSLGAGRGYQRLLNDLSPVIHSLLMDNDGQITPKSLKQFAESTSLETLNQAIKIIFQNVHQNTGIRESYLNFYIAFETKELQSERQNWVDLKQLYTQDTTLDESTREQLKKKCDEEIKNIDQRLSNLRMEAEQVFSEIVGQTLNPELYDLVAQRKQLLLSGVEVSETLAQTQKDLESLSKTIENADRNLPSESAGKIKAELQQHINKLEQKIKILQQLKDLGAKEKLDAIEELDAKFEAYKKEHAVIKGDLWSLDVGGTTTVVKLGQERKVTLESLMHL